MVETCVASKVHVYVRLSLFTSVAVTENAREEPSLTDGVELVGVKESIVGASSFIESFVHVKKRQSPVVPSYLPVPVSWPFGTRCQQLLLSLESSKS